MKQTLGQLLAAKRWSKTTKSERAEVNRMLLLAQGKQAPKRPKKKSQKKA